MRLCSVVSTLILHGAHETRDRKNLEVKFRGPNLLLDFFHNLGYETYLLSANMFVRPEFGFEGFSGFFDIYPFRNFSLLSPDEKKLLERLLIDSEHNIHKVVLKLLSDSHYGLLLKLPFNLLFSRLHSYYREKIHGWPIENGSKNAVRLVKALKFHEPTFILSI